jgi:outer membrane receptor protein involved in Fe transport
MMSRALHELDPSAGPGGAAASTRRRRLGALVAVGVLWLAEGPMPAAAQATSAVQGIVRDEQDAAIPGVLVALRHPSSGLERQATTDAHGRFVIANLPVGTYDVRLSLHGFSDQLHRVHAATAAPVTIETTMAVASLADTVTVVPETPVLDTTSGGTRHAVSVTRIDRMPLAVTSRGLESVLVAFPGFAQNANGAIHPRGAHNQTTFVIDGLAISDQLTGAFANALDVGVVQTAEVMMGHIPAEFGSKVSGVAVLNSRSGLGTGRALTGSVSATAGGFGTAQGSVQVGGERGRVGYFGSFTTMRTERFLDQVSLDNLHNTGHFARAFGRLDVELDERSHLRAHAMGGGSRFELANLRSQHAAGQDQRQALDDFSTWSSFVRTLDASSTLDATVGYRATTADLFPSAGDTPVTAAQDRRLSTWTGSVRYSRAMGRHALVGGAEVRRFPVDEFFTMGITSPTFNAPGTPGFNEALLPYDLTRGGSPFVFRESRAGTQVSAFVDSKLSLGDVTLSLGLRHDEYRFLVDGRHVQPRVAFAWKVRDDVVVRASYNRNYQTPPNENLLLSNSEAASQLAPPSVRDALGGAYRPIQPERQDVYEAGVQFSLPARLTLDASAYYKRSRDQQDNNNFFDTGIIFPTTLWGIEVTGAEARLSMQPRGGWSGSLSATTGRAISTPPFTGGLFLGQDAVDLLSSGPFAIDHDQRLAVHGLLSFDPPGPFWAGTSVRYDSGLVSNPSDPAVVAADPDFADLLPYVDLEAATPRVRPRTIVDLATGLDKVDASGRKTWGVQVQVTNLANRTALYNFQSVFVGTRLVQPRTVSVRVSRYF